ncbi:phage portal protein [Pontibacter qinzhouensis]|uniref:Phage portal protein n=1 Tax=Pontibacter qinzhouensis TaxID=2603253 RepID=A0A5C8KB14_9BACT|nr:phage portal protein [Pontibacter qinzhouensis]TXK52374.1 phage portal protein [Pontibacter qinzhouensis]
MTLEELASLKADKLIEAVTATKKENKYEEGKKQYDPNLHDVKSATHRPNKLKLTPTDKFEEDGVTPIVKKESTEPAKIAIPLQKYIIHQRASFAVGNKITFKSDVPESPVFEAALQTWRKAKMQYQLKEIAIKMMAETEVALIWYGKVDEKSPGKVKFRNRIVSPSTGDDLYPVFDKYNDMIAFGRGYKVDDVEYFDLYTAETLRRFKKGEKGMEEYFTKVGKDEEGNEIGIIEELPYGKIPVIYWRQELPECDDVKDLIRAREFNQSDFFDNNQYFGDPIMFLKGTALNMPAKGVAGKVMEGSADADAKILSPGDYTAARKLEFDMLDMNIFTLTRSAKLDAESMKGLGDLSAAAMDRMLISPHMAARDMQDGEFGRGVQRCMNFLLAVYSDILGIQDNVEAEPVFSLFRIDDAAERIELALKANGGKPVIDQQGSIEMAGTSDYPDEMIERIRKEAKEAQANVIGNTPPGPPKEELDD